MIGRREEAVDLARGSGEVWRKLENNWGGKENEKFRKLQSNAMKARVFLVQGTVSTTYAETLCE